MVVVGCSVWLQDISILIWWFGIVVSFLIICMVFALFNVVMWAPVFWLVSKLARPKKENKSSVNSNIK